MVRSSQMIPGLNSHIKASQSVKGGQLDIVALQKASKKNTIPQQEPIPFSEYVKASKMEEQFQESKAQRGHPNHKHSSRNSGTVSSPTSIHMKRSTNTTSAANQSKGSQHGGTLGAPSKSTKNASFISRAIMPNHPCLKNEASEHTHPGSAGADTDGGRQAVMEAHNKVMTVGRQSATVISPEEVGKLLRRARTLKDGAETDENYTTIHGSEEKDHSRDDGRERGIVYAYG